MKTAIFAGGCFWCVEHDLRALPGVLDAVSGYYGEGHRESVEVSYDPNIVSFKKLCQFFLDHIDPTDSGGQFHDRGESYKTAIFYTNDTEKQVAEVLIAELEESKIFAPLKIAVEILPAKTFYKAEDYHQNYSDKNIMHYTNYAKGSGRVQFVGQYLRNSRSAEDPLERLTLGKIYLNRLTL